jgi:hypothetical protein
MHCDYFCVQHSVVGLCGRNIFLILRFNLVLSIIYMNFRCERVKHILYLHTHIKYVLKVQNLIKVITRGNVKSLKYEICTEFSELVVILLTSFLYLLYFQCNWLWLGFNP